MRLTNMSDSPKKNAQQLLEAYSNSPWLNSVIKKIASHVASTSWYLTAPKNSKGKYYRHINLQYADFETREKVSKQLQMTNELVTIDKHPFLMLFNKPNPLMTGFDFREVSQMQLDIKGETFWWITKDVEEMPITMWVIPPTWVNDTPTKNKPYFDTNMRGTRVPIPQDEMLWLRSRNPADPYGRGVGIGDSLSDELDTDEYAAAMSKAFFYNRARPDFLIGIEGATSQQLEQAKTKWDDNHRGFWKSFRPHFYSGKINLHQLTSSFSDMKLTELRSWERDTIRSVYGVPAEIMGLTANSNRAAITQAMRIMAMQVVIPRLEFLRQQLQPWITEAFDKRLILNYENPLPADKELQLLAMSKASWAATRGEWRVMMGLKDRGDIDNIHMQPRGIQPKDPEDIESEQIPEDEKLLEIEEAKLPSLGEGESLQESVLGVKEGGDDTKENKEVVVIKGAIEDQIVDAMLPEAFSLRLSPVWEGEIEEWGNKVLSAELGMELTMNMQNPLIVEFLEKFSSEDIKHVNDTVKEEVRKALRAGVAEGESVPQLSKRVKEHVDEIYKNRSKVIARTEVVKASNFANFTAYDQSGIVEGKEWITTIDGRQRDKHEALDGDVVPLMEPFEIDSYKAMHPGNFGVASMDINCRCTTAAVVPETRSSKEERAKIWKQFDKNAQKWERQAVPLINAALRENIRAAIRRLKQLLA